MNGATSGSSQTLPYIGLSYDHKESERSVRELVYSIQPKWRDTPEQIKIVQFKDGITNTLLKLARHGPGMTQDEIDQDSVLMRAYGNNTDILIDRDREATSHQMCAKHGLAPPLLARFQNGLLYRFIPGEVCTPKDLGTEQTWRAIARRLGQWHATLPVSTISSVSTAANGVDGQGHTLAERLPSPNIWTVMRKWVHALPQGTSKEQTRKAFLEKELERSFQDLDNEDGPGEHGFVVGHCDLLSANVIKTGSTAKKEQHGVAFIDYEYSAAAPAAFDLANHFSEWTGYECDYNLIPTRSTRRAFLQEYLSSFNRHTSNPLAESTLEFLEKEVDRYRGMPGFYWGIWALIQATISQIDFNYAEYAELRLGEYTAWRREESGSRARESIEMPTRERRWAEA